MEMRRNVHPTSDQFRHAIDTGRTGDKVDAEDLSAVPLGTDEEAAGTPIKPQVLSKVFAEETRRGAQSTGDRSRNDPGVKIYFAVVGMVILALAAGLIATLSV